MQSSVKITANCRFEFSAQICRTSNTTTSCKKPHLLCNTQPRCARTRIHIDNKPSNRFSTGEELIANSESNGNVKICKFTQPSTIYHSLLKNTITFIHSSSSGSWFRLKLESASLLREVCDSSSSTETVSKNKIKTWSDTRSYTLTLISVVRVTTSTEWNTNQEILWNGSAF